jgi:hypothetical protein
MKHWIIAAIVGATTLGLALPAAAIGRIAPEPPASADAAPDQVIPASIRMRVRTGGF